MSLSLFESTLFSEAPEDEPEAPGPGPPDIPDMEAPVDADGDDLPPDLPEMDFDENEASGAEDEGGDEAPLEISDKISVVMNYRLYQRFLTLANTVANQISTIKGNSDVIHSVSPGSLGIIEPLGKLGENIRLYLTNNFLTNNYSRNLLFYNKCLNLLKMLDDIFSKEIRKGKH